MSPFEKLGSSLGYLPFIGLALGVGVKGKSSVLVTRLVEAAIIGGFVSYITLTKIGVKMEMESEICKGRD